MKWNGNNRKWYEDRGYIWTKQNEEFEVKVEDLPYYSKTQVECLCDYCLEKGIKKVISKQWNRYLTGSINSSIHKDCCKECQPIKAMESNLINYGVRRPAELDEVKQKMKQTTMEKYGVEHNMHRPEVVEKAKQTFLNHYGVDNPTKNKDIVQKATNTTIERYGTRNLYSIEKFKNKTIETNNKKYGTDWGMQNSEVMSKSRITFHKNGTAPCSRQQEYLWKLLGGELNYPIDKCSLDIAFPNDKIYIEYCGNGHELSVRMNNISEKDFQTKEIHRYMFLKSKGWKLIRINSFCDYLPLDMVIINEFNKAKEWFKSNDEGHWHYNIDIGNLINDTKYGKLRKIKEEDLQEIV
jgi:hypothetical protein